MSNLKNITLELASIYQFDKIYSDMIVQFPASELKSYSRFLELFASNQYKLYLAKTNDLTVGYVILAFESDIAWLDYLAIFKEYHSCGYGKTIVKSFKKEFPNCKGCFLEVEKIDETVINTLRRVRFYENCGAFRLNREYSYPNESGSLPMDLFFLPFVENLNLTDIIIDEHLTNVFKLLHSELPHAQNVLRLNLSKKSDEIS